jgi:asparagine synthase (glutamine-hydrolysing)
MCGISGFFGRRITPGVSEKFGKIHNCLKHRGPNGSSIWESDRESNSVAIVGHHRLSINDLSDKGIQPLTGKNNSRIIVNGEIYNSPYIRSKLPQFEFKTGSDSESLLAVLDTFGLEGLKMVDGMFAFAFLPEGQNEIWIGRDRLGIKPVYWARDSDGFWFASEARPLANALGKKLDGLGVAEWSLFQLQTSDRSFYEEVRTVKPGEVLIVANDKVRSVSYWKLDDYLSDSESPAINQHDVSEELKSLFNDSIKSHMLSDVPIATLVSGGMDSSWVASVASKHGVTQGYSGRYLEPGCDESPFAQKVAEKSNLDLHLISIDFDSYFEALTSFAKNMDYPTAGPGAVGQFIIAKEVSKDYRVLLSGTGGDELFLGYTRDRLPLIAQGLLDATSKKSTNWGHIAGNISSLIGYEKLYTRFANGQGFTSPISGFISLITRADDNGGIFLVSEEIQKEITDNLILQLNSDGSDSILDLSNSILRYEIGKFLPSLLHVEDRVTMSWGVESRLPFLSQDLIEFCLGLPVEARFYGTRPKDLMRKAAASDLPREVLLREDKMGFPVPLESWARGDGRQKVNKIVSDLRDRNLPYLQNKRLDDIVSGVEVDNRSLWGIITFSIWMQSIES